jgi:hypothetical protein
MCFVKLPLSLIMSASICLGFPLGTRLCEKKIWLFTRSCFHKELLEFQSYSEQKSF